MSFTVYQVHSVCYSVFQDACTAAEGSAYHYQLCDEFDKYNLWAGNVGAIHTRKRYTLSLDYRLRGEPYYKDQVCTILRILRRFLQNFVKLTNSDTVSKEDRDGNNLRSELDTPDQSSTTSESESDGSQEDSPWEISDEEDGPVAPKAANVESASQLNGDPLQQLLESIKVAVKSLYKLQIRKAASVERLDDFSVAESSPFAFFDMLYVKDKFPDMRLDSAVHNRLGKMITRRRQLLIYCKRHKQNLRVAEVQPSLPTSKNESIQIEPSSTNELQEHSLRASALGNTPGSRSQAESSQIKTKASTFRPEQMLAVNFAQLDAPSVAESDSRSSQADLAINICYICNY